MRRAASAGAAAAAVVAAFGARAACHNARTRQRQAPPLPLPSACGRQVITSPPAAEQARPRPGPRFSAPPSPPPSPPAAQPRAGAAPGGPRRPRAHSDAGLRHHIVHVFHTQSPSHPRGTPACPCFMRARAVAAGACARPPPREKPARRGRRACGRQAQTGSWSPSHALARSRCRRSGQTAHACAARGSHASLACAKPPGPQPKPCMRACSACPAPRLLPPRATAALWCAPPCRAASGRPHPHPCCTAPAGAFTANSARPAAARGPGPRHQQLPGATPALARSVHPFHTPARRGAPVLGTGRPLMPSR